MVDLSGYERARLVTTSVSKMLEFERLFNKYKFGWITKHSS